MDATEILSSLGRPLHDDSVEDLLNRLGTVQRPELPSDNRHVFHDWVLVRRRGVELGFVDSQYQEAAARPRWRHGDLILSQAYFYAGAEGIAPFAGALPFDLRFSDTRDVVRSKLAAFEADRRSHITDAWNVGAFNLSVAYRQGDQAIDRMACRIMAKPIRGDSTNAAAPSLHEVVKAFGSSLDSPDFTRLWSGVLDDAAMEDAREEGEVDLTQSFGATLVCAGTSAPCFKAIVLHRNRDRESVGWSGDLPNGLHFDDSPEVLFRKLPVDPAQQADEPLTGHGVWHFEDFTLHVLYSNVDNRLLRVKLSAPGTWGPVGTL